MKLTNKKLKQTANNQNCKGSVSLKPSLLSCWLYAILNFPIMLSNFLYKFVSGKFRLIRDIAIITKKHYRAAKWEILLYRLNKESITFWAQWIREGHGWILINRNLEVKPLILELFRALKETRLLAYFESIENRNVLNCLESFLKNGFPIIIPHIKESIEGINQKEQSNGQN
jgi:hypothetical protein